jgi:hypothetical protein
MFNNNNHIHELIYATKRESHITFKQLDEWYNKYYLTCDSHRYINAIAGILADFVEKNNITTLTRLIHEIDPTKLWHSEFNDLSKELNEQYPYRLTATFLSIIRLTEVKKIPGFAEYVAAIEKD